MLFTLLSNGDVAMELPELYLQELDTLLKLLSDGTGTVTLKEAERTVGKACRISQRRRPVLSRGPVRSIHQRLKG